MEVIKIIEEYIMNNDMENAYETIIKYEDEYKSNSDYWNLRGMLCIKINEYNAAIGCYKTSIRIDYTNLDSHYNLIYMYKIIGEKLKSVLYAGIALKYIDDNNFFNDIRDIYKEEPLAQAYIDLLNEVRLSHNIEYEDLDIIKYLASKFENIDKKYIDMISKEKLGDTWAYVKSEYVVTSKEIIAIESLIENQQNSKYNVIVLYNEVYIDITRKIASEGIKQCFILVPNSNRKLELVEIDNEIMFKLKNNDYKNTITLNKFNAADSNIYALIKYMPQKYKTKYKLNIIYGRDVLTIDNIVKVPLISCVTVSGFNTFINYPKFTYNIDVGHAGIIMKNCGLMDKKYKNFSFTPQEYKQIDKVCVASQISMLIQSAFSAIPENKYEITGNPRTDTLILSNGKQNLEKLLNINLKNKKIIFNMPTFHIHENSGVVNGEQFNEAIKIKNINYKKLDKFLKDNQIICISKVHHAEERFITNKVKNLKLENLLFISNEDLDRNKFDLYEILNSADMLITDYSSVYGDFLFMDKPIIFVNQDIDKYRKERGLSLEPYDFWTAGPKVQSQNQLEEEIKKYLNDDNYYKQKRQEIRNVFFKYKDSNSTLRVWNHIDNILNNIK